MWAKLKRHHWATRPLDTDELLYCLHSCDLTGAKVRRALRDESCTRTFKCHICRSFEKLKAFVCTRLSWKFLSLCDTTRCDLLLIWIYVTSLLCFYFPHVHQKQSIRFLMVIKQIKKWIKVASCGLWCNIHPVLKHNEPEWFNRDTAYPEVQTNKRLGRVSWGAKVALMSTMVSVLWVTLIWTAQ